MKLLKLLPALQLISILYKMPFYSIQMHNLFCYNLESDDFGKIFGLC